MMNNRDSNSPLAEAMVYWRTIVRHKWRIFIPTVALTLLGAMVITILPDRYRATTLILVEPKKVPDQYVTPTIRENLTERLQTIYEEVMSSTRLQEIMDQYGLYADQRGKMSRDELVEDMRKDIKLEVKRASGSGPGAFTISYRGSDPSIVAQVTNRLAANFIEWSLKSREQLAIGTTQFLSDQLDVARRELEEQENAVRNFKMRHLGQMPEHLPANLQAIAQYQATLSANAEALNRLERERQELKIKAEDATVLVRPGGVVVGVGGERVRLETEKAALEAQLTQLRTQYTDAHPDVVAVAGRLERVNGLLKSLPSPKVATDPSTTTTVAPADTLIKSRLAIIELEMARLNKEQERIQARIAAYQSKADAVPLREQQLADLTRDYLTTKMRYQSLLEKKSAAEMSADLERQQKGERFTILDPARVPEKPYQPNRPLLMLASLFVALMLSVGTVIVRDMLDPTVKAEQDVRRLLPASVKIFAPISRIQNVVDRRRERVFAVLVLTLSLLACLGVAGFIWKVHPNL